MADKITPIISSLLLTPLALPAAATAPVVIESTIPAQSGHRATLRKALFDSSYQSNIQALSTTQTPMGGYVSELQELWQFPSDHLPIGMTLNGTHIASWNVLNSAYMSWVLEKNSQGLSRSLLAQEHIPVNDSGLTLRDVHVIECIKSMLEHPTNPRSILALQECGPAFIEELQRQLSEDYGIVFSCDPSLPDQNIVIYDKRVFAYDPSKSEIKTDVFANSPGRSVMSLCFNRGGDVFIQQAGASKNVRIINAHLPGEPGSKAPEEFAAYVASVTSPDEITIAMGDMNFNEIEMGAAFAQNTPNGYHLDTLSPYCTNVGPYTFNSKAIDHFFVFGTDKHVISQNSPEETLIGLQETVDLLSVNAFAAR